MLTEVRKGSWGGGKREGVGSGVSRRGERMLSIQNGSFGERLCVQFQRIYPDLERSFVFVFLRRRHDVIIIVVVVVSSRGHFPLHRRKMKRNLRLQKRRQWK